MAEPLVRASAAIGFRHQSAPYAGLMDSDLWIQPGNWPVYPLRPVRALTGASIHDSY